MTLILTALVKNGICVCADRRRSTWSGGVKVHQDGFSKILRFPDAPIIMFNHGVNQFAGRFWDAYCLDYHATNAWRGKQLMQIAQDFKVFLEKPLLRQLRQNERDFAGNAQLAFSAFVVCGKDSSSGRFEFHELAWSPHYSLQSWTDTRIIGSGQGYEKYLGSYLLKDPRSNSTEHWGGLKTAEATKELETLFAVALAAQGRANGDEFSETFDTECISD